MIQLLTTANAKTAKGQVSGYLTGVLYLAPHNLSGKNVCQFASSGCAAACLYTAGRGVYTNVQKSRLAKTALFWKSPKNFIDILKENVSALIRKGIRENLIPCVRLNGTSDLPWETIKGNNGQSVIEAFPEIQFYDYTKNPARMKAYLRGEMPKNYHLTFSRSECNHNLCLEIMAMGGNVAAVFEKMPDTWCGKEVVTGDNDDLRFLDKAGVIVGLKAKGKARHDKSGFVVVSAKGGKA